MKSRIISKPDEIVLLYNTPEAEKILSSEGVRIISVPQNKAGEKLAYLCGESGFSSNGTDLSRQERCMVFCGLSGNRLNGLLAKLKAAGTGAAYKAVLTPSNRSWTLSALIDELKKEHEFMGRA